MTVILFIVWCAGVVGGGVCIYNLGVEDGVMKERWRTGNGLSLEERKRNSSFRALEKK